MKLLSLLLLTFVSKVAISQTLIEAYTVAVKPLTINGLPGIQSASLGYHNDEVIIIGGRLDGNHRRQPNVSFDAAGNNNRLFVINLKTAEI